MTGRPNFRVSSDFFSNVVVLSFFNFNSCHLFTDNNNSLVRVLISSFIPNAFEWDSLISVSNQDILPLRVYLGSCQRLFSLLEAEEFHVDKDMGSVLHGDSLLVNSLGELVTGLLYS